MAGDQFRERRDAERATGVDHELGRRLDQAAVALVRHEFGAVEDRPHQSLHVVLAATKRVAEVLDVTGARARGHKVLDDFVRDQRRGGGLSQDAVDHSLGVERARLAEEGDASFI